MNSSFNAIRRRRRSKTKPIDLIPVMFGNKPWWESTTIQGAIVGAINVIVLLTNFKIDPSDVQLIIQSLIGLISTGMVIWGRVKANTEITAK